MSCIIVLGCYRSGTSAVAGILYHLGVMMGKEFDKPQKSNPKGYFEDIEFKSLHTRLTEAKEVEGLLKVLIRMREAEHKLWGVKDPQLCLLLNKFVPLLKTDHKIISTLRPKEDICDSLVKAAPLGCDGLSYMPLIEYYLSRKESALADYTGPVLNVEFSQLKLSPKEQVEKIAEFIGVPVTQEAISHVQVA